MQGFERRDLKKRHLVMGDATEVLVVSSFIYLLHYLLHLYPQLSLTSFIPKQAFLILLSCI